jgi:phage shock protein A
MKTEKEKLREDIDYWREQSVLAEEQGDELLAKEYLERAAALQRRLVVPDLVLPYSNRSRGGSE